MKAIIIDDELLPGKLLEAMLEKYCFEISDVEVFTSALKAIEHLKENTYDVLFLDVEMPEMNSFDFLKRAMLPNETELIFVTAHSQYAIEAIKVEATHYLLKPVDQNELIVAVRRAHKNWEGRVQVQNESSERISIYDGEKYVIIDKADIIRMEADGSYTKIVLEGKPDILASRRLGYFEQKLPGNDFFRCHNSHLVNILHIKSVERGKTGFIKLKNEEEIPLSHTKRNGLKILLGFDE